VGGRDWAKKPVSGRRAKGEFQRPAKEDLRSHTMITFIGVSKFERKGDTFPPCEYSNRTASHMKGEFL